MDYSELYTKLMALAQDSGATPAERGSARRKAVEIHNKYLKGKPKQGPMRAGPRFRPEQFYGPGLGSIFDPSEMADFKKGMERVLRDIINERDELKRTGKL